VLLVSEDPTSLQLVKSALAGSSGEPFDLEVADALSVGRRLLDSGEIDALLMDSGDCRRVELDAIRDIRETYPAIPMVVLTCKDDEEFGVAAVRAGAQDHIFRGVVNSRSLARTLRHAYERQRVRELVRSKAAAEEANHAKSEFIALISHEIRTPLNAILGMAEVLDETKLTSEQEEYVQVFRKSGEALQLLIEDILDLAKAEVGRLALEETEFNLVEVVEKTLDFLALKANERGLQLSYTVGPDVPVILRGDPHRLRQVLINLFSNAIKFSNEGIVSLTVQKERDPEHPSPETNTGSTVHFAVLDTGIGIPPDKLEVIFDSFTQVRSARSRLNEGAGLGLSICRRLVQMMGGRIWAESALGQGSTFHFTVYFGHSQSPMTYRGMLRAALSGMTILIVDANPDHGRLLAERLSNWGAQVTEAGDATQALEDIRRRQHANLDPYKLVILSSPIPDIVQLMVPCAEWSGRCPRGQDTRTYMVVPIAESRLADDIVSVLRETADSLATATPEPLGQAIRPARILLVDDDAENRFVVESYLKWTPHRVDIATNGLEALEMFKSEQYALVLMDVRMPVMNGHEATRAIRQWESREGKNRTPIIALTAFALPQEAEESMASGCDAHLTKPLGKRRLLGAIQEYTAMGIPQDTGDMDAVASELIQVEPELEEFVPMFLENRRSDVLSLRDALAVSDFDSIERVGHRMKGLGGIYGFHRVTEIGRAIEEAAQAKEIDSARDWVDRLHEHLQTIAP